MGLGRVLFLDIDGVLNGHEWIHREHSNSTWTASRINQEPARILHLILEQTGAEVVLISSWRHWVNDGLMTPKGFAKVLQSHGVKATVIDALPAKEEHLDHAEDRARKLVQWLENNKPKSYVAMDDLDLLPYGVKYQIRPNPAVGLVETDIRESLIMFEQQES